MEPELISGLVGTFTSIATLGFFYWRSLKIAKASRVALESRFNQEITALKERSQATESALQSKLTEVTSRLQASEVTSAKLAAEIIALTQQCQRLREELKTQAAQVQADAIDGGFEQIQTLLTQYPSVRKMVESQPDLPARNIVALLTSLENLIKFWECQSIGKPWEMVPYDPQIHQSDIGDIQTGESVYVRFVGYCKGDRILIPAKVSRTLPTRAKS
ncbi:molecular chaperone GrpE [Chamaesiphon sp. GL140_3_metabinner_50]|uniref:molecular chaperone GrpE n=1 Tax=Chamaesiphon sp. GL140_3_metabinner_50 TaxID=2970812 RepID=UPI0025CE2159|nr:molecular chaperone GrpE [Chamaesiphon sp. GL140_3_metabinner_50]